MPLLLTIVASLTVFTSVLLIICWNYYYRSYNEVNPENNPHIQHTEISPIPQPLLYEFPQVCILLAVRNEEENLAACLDHLLAQQYPQEKYTIWIGNDASTDRTRQIAAQYASAHSQIYLVDINQQVGNARAKANVIAQLVAASGSHEQPSDLLLVTDADTRPPNHWMSGMIQSWQHSAGQHPMGITTGTTLVIGKSAWSHFQRIDWLFSLGMVKVVSDMGYPTATLGNNNMMSRKAYTATGGYENLPFSITEDFQILQAITQSGFSFRNTIHPYTINFTLPMTGIRSLIEQRRRWMQGALQLPWYIIAVLLLQAVFYPVIIIIALSSPLQAGIIFLTNVTIQSYFIVKVIKRLQLRPKVKRKLFYYLLPYNIYAALIGLLTLAYYFIPNSIRWKGRSF